jgi:TonB-linked SusC/RagA family outer membrane protein
MKQSKHQTVAYWMNMLSKQLSKRLMLTILLFSCVTMFHANPLDIDQKRVVTGYVTERETGETLPGASVSIKGTSKGSMTDIDGKYSIEVDSNSDVLVFSYIGKKVLERTVGTHNTIDVTLEDDATVLKEVVIQTGYMTQKKADLTGSLAIASASDIAKNPSGNAMKGLQGKLPGVYITSNGNPADEVGIQIRGITSLNASAPLVVIDGQPVDINLRDINTMNIESIQVLKDAASASIYGSRAASGVILIETKKGKKGELNVSYDGSVTFSKLVHKPDMLNTEEYGRALWQANVNSGNRDPQGTVKIFEYDWNGDIRNPILHSLNPIPWLNSAETMPSADTDWFDAVTKTGITQRHQITVSQGNERSKSLYSLSYYDNEGYQIGTFFTQISARINTEYDLIKGRLKIGENFETSYLKYRSANEIENAVTMPPILPTHTTDGGWAGTATEKGMDDIWNPLRLLEMNKHNTEKFNKIIGSTYLDLMIIDGLHAKTQFGVNYSNGYHRHLRKSWVEGGGKRDTENGVDNSQSHSLEYVWQNTLNYAKIFGKHDISAVAGVEYTKFESDGFSAYKDDLLIEDLDYALLHLADGTKTALKGWTDEWALFSYFAKANYVFDTKYLFSATIRYDGSSKFGKNNRWGLFPAFSAGWRIKNEKFMESFDFLSDLKLRASWGINGNSRPLSTSALTDLYEPNYGGDVYHRTSYAIKGQETGLLQNGHRRSHTGNADLKWEETKQTNLGFDFGFFDQRLNGSFDYFYKKTTGILFEPAYPGAFGDGGYQWINGATLDNKGVELIVSYSNDHRSAFQYTISGNLSTYKNRILEIPESNKYAYGGNGITEHMIGKPRNSVYGYVADGIFKTQDEVDNHAQQTGKGIGRIRWKDLDGDGQITANYDRTWIANSDPDFLLGLSFSSSYKSFDFSMDWQGVFGQHVYDSWKVWGELWPVAAQPGKNHPRTVLDAWSTQNPDSDIPALSTGNSNKETDNSTYTFSDASYMKLRNIEIGYSFPQSLIRQASMSRLRIYASAHNVLTIKKWWADDKFQGPDPEIANFNYLRPLQIMFGVNVSF